MNGYVYILKSEKNGRYYVGSTNNIERRLREHNNRTQKATKYIAPLKLIHTEKYDSLLDARRRERKIKSWKSRKKIEELISDMGL